jgi:hypothetical protein
MNNIFCLKLKSNYFDFWLVKCKYLCYLNMFVFSITNGGVVLTKVKIITSLDESTFGLLNKCF